MMQRSKIIRIFVVIVLFAAGFFTSAITQYAREMAVEVKVPSADGSYDNYFTDNNQIGAGAYEPDKTFKIAEQGPNGEVKLVDQLYIPFPEIMTVDEALADSDRYDDSRISLIANNIIIDKAKEMPGIDCDINSSVLAYSCTDHWKAVGTGANSIEIILDKIEQKHVSQNDVIYGKFRINCGLRPKSAACNWSAGSGKCECDNGETLTPNFRMYADRINSAESLYIDDSQIDKLDSGLKPVAKQVQGKFFPVFYNSCAWEVQSSYRLSSDIGDVLLPRFTGECEEINKYAGRLVKVTGNIYRNEAFKPGEITCGSSMEGTKCVGGYMMDKVVLIEPIIDCNNITNSSYMDDCKGQKVTITGILKCNKPDIPGVHYIKLADGGMIRILDAFDTCGQDPDSMDGMTAKIAGYLHKCGKATPCESGLIDAELVFSGEKNGYDVSGQSSSKTNSYCTNPQLEDCDGKKVRITGTVRDAGLPTFFCELEKRSAKYTWGDNCLVVAPIGADEARILGKYEGKRVEMIGTISASDGEECGKNGGQCAGKYNPTTIEFENVFELDAEN